MASAGQGEAVSVIERHGRGEERDSTTTTSDRRRFVRKEFEIFFRVLFVVTRYLSGCLLRKPHECVTRTKPYTSFVSPGTANFGSGRRL